MFYTYLRVCECAALMLECKKPDFSSRAFARQIGRHHSTISRELERNNHQSSYDADADCAKIHSRRRRGHRKLSMGVGSGVACLKPCAACGHPSRLPSTSSTRALKGLL